MEEKLLIRVVKKEYLFEKEQFDYNLLMEIIFFFKNASDVMKFQKKQREMDNEDKAMKHLYLLTKLESIKNVDSDYIDSDINNYLFRNYEDYKTILNSAPLDIFLVEKDEDIKYHGLGIYASTYLEENLLALIETEKQFEQFILEIRYKKKWDRVSANIKELIINYGKLLSWDYYSSFRKYQPYFVITKYVEIINYSPFCFNLNQMVTNNDLDVKLREKHHVVSSFVNYLIQHPSFFLQYTIDKTSSSMYSGEFYFRGYNYENKFVEGSGYLETMSKMLDKVLRESHNFRKVDPNVMNFTYQKGELMNYHQELYLKAGIVVTMGGS
jgi:hypothetical protein